LKLEELKSAASGSSSGGDEGPRRRSKPVQAILAASQKGHELEHAGIIGRLGDLATIADEYDIAISTACSSLDYIVVKTTAGANLCLDYLRQYNSGRASFICLDKLSKGAHDRQVETPENAPRLFDLIRPVYPSLLPAFFLAIGNTLVADDIDTAARWCYDFGSKRWRVVCRDGTLLETSGTQSGGGGNQSQRKGGMKLEVRALLSLLLSWSSLWILSFSM
jgi:structural maintenance of chromosome 4